MKSKNEKSGKSKGLTLTAHNQTLVGPLGGRTEEFEDGLNAKVTFGIAFQEQYEVFRRRRKSLIRIL